MINNHELFVINCNNSNHQPNINDKIYNLTIDVIHMNSILIPPLH